LLNYDKLSKKPLLFRSFTGLEPPEFDSIRKKLESKNKKTRLNVYLKGRELVV
jgi:hypothetical protein